MVQRPLAKTGQVGTSLAPPVPGQPDSFTHYLHPDKGWVPSSKPGAAGYTLTATVAGNKRGHHDGQDDPDGEGEHGGLDFGISKTGGAQTIDKQFTKMIQTQAERPQWFDQRTSRYLAFRNRQAAMGSPHVDAAGNPLPERQPNAMPMKFTGNTYTHAPNRDAEGNARKRVRRLKVAGSRDTVEPAVRVPMSPDRKASLMRWAAGDPEYLQKQSDYYASIGDERMAKKFEDDKLSLDPEYCKQKIAQYTADGNPQIAAKYEKRLAARLAFQRLGRGLRQPDSLVPDKGEFGRGNEQEPTGELDNDGKPIYSKKVNPNTGTAIKQSHQLPMLRRILPNLYNLSAAADTSNPVLVSQGLAQELHDNVETTRSIRLKMGDDSIGDQLIRKNYGTYIKSENARPMKFIIDPQKKVGDRYLALLMVGKKPYSCYFAHVDKQGEVMFRYKADTKEHEQPILSPGKLNTMMKDSEGTLMGGHKSGPAGESERIGYGKEKRNNSMFGPQRDDGTWDTNPDPKSKLGWSTTINKAVTKGVRDYIYGKMSPKDTAIADEMKSPEVQTELINMANMLAMNNLKNGKFLDTKEGDDTYFNMGHLHRLFPHLYAVLKMLDNLVTRPARDDNELEGKRMLWEAGKTPPSKMTLVQFKEWLGNPNVQQVINANSMNVRVRTNRLIRRDKKTGGLVYKKNFSADRHHDQYDQFGRFLKGDEGVEGAMHGWTTLGVGADQIWQMIQDARLYYLRWIGKDMARKVINSKSAKGEGKYAGIGSYGDDSKMGIESATRYSQYGARAELAMKAGGKGYNRYRGKMEEYIEEKQRVPKMLRRELESLKSQYNGEDEAIAVKIVHLSIMLNQSLHDLLAYKDLEQKTKRLDINPDLNEPWTDDNRMIYIVKHLPERLKAIQQYESKSDTHHLRLAATEERAEPFSQSNPQGIMEKAKAEAGKEYRSDIAETVGAILGGDDDDVTMEDRKHAVQFAKLISAGKMENPETGDVEDVDNAHEIEAAVSYHAIHTLMVGLQDELYSDVNLRFIRQLVSYLIQNDSVHRFTNAAKILLADHEHGKIK